MSDLRLLAVTAALAVAAEPSVAECAADDESASAQQSSVNVELGYDLTSRYVFRGLDVLGGEPLHASSAEFEVGDFSLSASAYLGEMPDAMGGGEYREMDLEAAYTWELGDSLSLSLGALGYFYGRATGIADSGEVYFEGAFARRSAEFSLSYFHDVAAVDGGYASLRACRGFAFDSEASVALGFDFGYNDPSSRGDPNDLLVGIDVPFALGDHLRVHALVERSFALGALEEIGGKDATIVTLGLSLDY